MLQHQPLPLPVQSEATHPLLAVASLLLAPSPSAIARPHFQMKGSMFYSRTIRDLPVAATYAQPTSDTVFACLAAAAHSCPASGWTVRHACGPTVWGQANNRQRLLRRLCACPFEGCSRSSAEREDHPATLDNLQSALHYMRMHGDDLKQRRAKTFNHAQACAKSKKKIQNLQACLDLNQFYQ